MPPTPGRHRGSRPQIQNQIGEFGRTTGIRPPRRVQRDSNGLEDPDDFFNKADESDPELSQDDDYHRRAASYATDSDADSDGLGSIPHSTSTTAAKHKGLRHAPRPDKFLVGEDRGRKTGVYRAPLPRGSDGFEPVDDFFNSPSPTRSTATAQSTVRRTAQTSKTSYAGSSRSERTEYYEDEQDVEMSFDADTTTLSPSVHQRAQVVTKTIVAGSSATARRPSSLRHSTLPNSRRGLSKSNSTSSPIRSESGDEQDVVSSSRPERRRLSSLTRQDSGQYSEEPFVEELDLESQDEGDSSTQADRTIFGQVDDEEEDEPDHSTGTKHGARKSTAKQHERVTHLDKGKRRAIETDDDEEQHVSSTNSRSKQRRESRASSAGLVKLDRNGRPVAVADKKGKGKAVERSPSPPQDNQGDPDENGYDYPDHDYGGGGESDDPEAAAFRYGSYEESPEPQREGSLELAVDDAEPELQDEDDQAEPSPGPPAAKKTKKTTKTKAKVVKAAPDKSRTKKRRSDVSTETVVAKRARKATPNQERVITQIPRDRDRDAGSAEVDGVRRSHRQRLEPLEYWRNERVIYKKRASGVGMTAIVRIPKEEPEPLTTVGRKKRAKSSAPPSRGAAARERARSVKSEPIPPDEDGVDDMTDPDGLVWSWEGNAETTRRIAFTAKMMDPKPTFNNQYQFQKIYQELDYLAGGVLVIPVGGQKSTKPAKDNSYIFFCVQGSVSVVCHRTRVSIGTGGTFFIPRGNSYSIEATSNRPVKLFFAQGRRVIELEDGSTRPDTIESSQRVLQAVSGSEPSRSQRRRSPSEPAQSEEDEEEEEYEDD